MFRFFGGKDDEDESSAHLAEQPSLIDRAAVAVGLQPEPSVREAAISGMCPDMTFKQRLYGFATCWVIGVVICVSSMMSFSKLVSGNPVPFAVKYSVGNIIAICSTAFLVSPKRQLRKMSHPTRWGASVVYVLAIAATLVSAFAAHSAILVIICIIVQVRSRRSGTCLIKAPRNSELG